MKDPTTSKIIVVLMALSVSLLGRAANISMTASDAINTSSLNSAGKWSNGQAPVSTNDYFSGPYFIRTPGGSGGVVFAGHSLTLQNVIGGGQGSPQRSILYKGGGGDTIVINNLTNATMGVLDNGGSGNVAPPRFTGNLWTIAGNSTILSDQGSTIIGYPLAGPDGVVLTNTSGQGRTITYTNSLAGFTGKFNIVSSITVAFSNACSNLGNPSTPTPDQITINSGCTLVDLVGLMFNNANGGFTLIGTPTINTPVTTVIGEPITDLTNGVSSVSSLTTAGGGTLVLSNANNTYRGGTTISTGTLQMGVANGLPNVGSVTATATLDLNTYNTAIDGLNGAGTVDTVAGGTPTLTVGASGGNGTFTGVIRNTAGTLSLTKIGAGTETLSGADSYSGTTTATGGTLIINTIGAPTTTGSLVVSNGATLTVVATNGTALSANNVTVGPVGILSVGITGATNAINATGTLTFQNNSTNLFGYGNLSGNPTGAAIIAAGISALGSGIVLQITETGMKPGVFPLIKYGGTQLASLANFTLVMPLGVVANLVNNSGEIDVNITSTPQSLAWNGLNGPNWDTSTPNWTNAAAGTIAVYQEYNIGGTMVGDSVTFNDTLTNDFVNPQPTNINLTAGLNPYPVTVNSTLPYTIAGSGGFAGPAISSVTKNNTGSLTLLVTNNFGGGFNINAGSVIITNDSALGAASGLVTLNGGTLQVNGNTTDNARSFSVPATSTIGVLTNVVAQFGGATGVGGLTKTDNGTLVLAGSDGITGTLTVNQGTLTTLGTNVLAAVPLIGNVAGLNGVLNIGGGVFQANNNGGQPYSSSLTIGNAGGSAGLLVMGGGTLTVNRQLTVGGGAYGGLNMSGGTVNIGGFIACGGTTQGGAFNQSGGTVGMNGAATTIGYGAAGNPGVMNLSGNAVFNMIGNGNGIWPGEVGIGTLNVSGNAALTITNDGISLGRNNGRGTVDLDGGVVTVNFITNGPVAGTVNFNGGTLRANANGAFTKGNVPTAFNVFSNGAVIDDGGNNITFTRGLSGMNANSGYGIADIILGDGSGGGLGSGYVAPPVVLVTDTITNPATGMLYGSNATAIAQMDPTSGTVTNIVITCPGSGFDPLNSTLAVTFAGGGAAVTPPLIFNYDFIPATDGGLTKTGNGTLTMTGVNTFSGPVNNQAGTLVLNSASTYPGAVNVNGGTLSLSTASVVQGLTTVSNGAILSIIQTGATTNNMGNLVLDGGAAVPGATLGLGVTGLNPTTPLINCGTLTVNGTNSISLAGSVKVGSIPLVHYAGALGGSGTITNLELPQGVQGFVSNSAAGATLYAVITSTGPGLVWTGTNSGAGLTNLWDIAGTTNWLINATATAYHQILAPGDAVQFNDAGTGTVILNTNVAPANLLISNNAVNYTFSGKGQVSGLTGVQKLGAGTAVLNWTNNNYAGDTVISNGTLQIGNATALSSGANLNVGPGGTLELGGLTITVGELVGSGVIDNNSGINPVLTVGTSAGGVWNGTIQDHGAGAVALHKVGSGTWIVGGTNNLNDGQPFSDQCLITAGSVIITNGGAVSVAQLQLQIANGAGNSATVVVAGGTLAVTNNVLSVGYGSATASGTLVVNGGTVVHGGPGGGAFAAVPNSIDVGAQGATGTLTVNGGQVLNGQPLYLGDGTGANGTLNLNGGLLQASALLRNGAPTTSAANFNGGTLQAATNSANFLQVNCLVMSNGLALDDDGWNLNIGGAVLQDGGGGGGLLKIGPGAVYLDVANTYTGGTVVSNGTLAGIGSVAGNVTVLSGGNLGAGDAATNGIFTIGGNLTLQGNATLRISKSGGIRTNDQVSVTGSLNYGGALNVVNITGDGTPLAPGDQFQVFNKGGSGNFTSVAGAGGVTYTFDPSTGLLTVATVGPGTFTNPTGIQSITMNGSNLILTGTNGQAGDAYYLLQSTNVALPLSQWQTVATNVLSASGSYTFIGTNVVTPGGAQQFYILSNTNANH